MNPENWSLDDLENVKTELAELVERETRYSGNNPEKFSSGIRALVRQRDEITADLKQRGILPEKDEEALIRRLDDAFPHAASKQVVEFEGMRYRKRFRPAETSRSGKTVTHWEHWWEQVDNS